ncbi:MAG: glycoside hydrolase N-terminal domain-containing protein [Muribaculaceae bacterium]|nr:glycoside hydrolase N-terminal domain-containing protein [Muribaculaceae bacterium]
MKKFLLAILVVVSTMFVGNAYADCSFGNYSSSGRKLTSFGVTDGTTTTSVSVNQTTSGSIYYNRKSTVFETSPGEEIKFSDLTWEGAWMHGYLFIDYNGDGEFNQTLNADGTTGGEVVSYSYYNSKNSAGESASDGAGLPNATIMPSFTIPGDIAAGTYTARFKVDWNSLDPCGNSASNNNIAKNGGCVVDFSIKINAPKDMEIESVSVEKRSGEVNCGEKNIVLASVNFKADGGLNPYTVSSLTVKYIGTSDTDITNLRLIYSRSGNLTTEVIAEKIGFSRKSVTFSCSKALSHGNNYFLLVADVANTAAIGNSIKVSATKYIINEETLTLTDTAEGEYLVSNVVDYTKGNAIWFDTPNSSTAGVAIWNTNDFSSTSTNPDQNWEKKSFPIGNGSLGATIMGAVNKERVVMNEKTLWKGGPGTGVTNYWNMNKTVSSSTLQQVRNYLVQGNNSSAHSLVQSNYNGTVSYNKNVFGTFTMMGEAYVETGISESNVTNYKRIMNMDSSMVVVKFDANGIGYTRKYFCSYPDSVMVWKYQSKGGTQNLTFSFNCPQVVNSVT